MSDDFIPVPLGELTDDERARESELTDPTCLHASVLDVVCPWCGDIVNETVDIPALQATIRIREDRRR